MLFTGTFDHQRITRLRRRGCAALHQDVAELHIGVAPGVEHGNDFVVVEVLDCPASRIAQGDFFGEVIDRWIVVGDASFGQICGRRFQRRQPWRRCGLSRWCSGWCDGWRARRRLKCICWCWRCGLLTAARDQRRRQQQESYPAGYSLHMFPPHGFQQSGSTVRQWLQNTRATSGNALICDSGAHLVRRCDLTRRSVARAMHIWHARGATVLSASRHTMWAAIRAAPGLVRCAADVPGSVRVRGAGHRRRYHSQAYETSACAMQTAFRTGIVPSPGNKPPRSLPRTGAT
jgi:hypothetical protein